MNEDINFWSSQCIKCQRDNVNRHKKSPISKIPIPKCRCKYIHLNVVGPLRQCKGHTIYIKQIVLHSTIPLRDISSSIISTFYKNFICRFAVPLTDPVLIKVNISHLKYFENGHNVVVHTKLTH